MGWQMAAAGYTGVWATENTREAIWDALKRKEAYSTTGPRMTVRFFGGWDFDASDAQTRMPAEAGYAKGVPMGGDLRQPPAGKSPSFLAAALKDPLSGNLDRIQIIKGWVDASGELHEKVYDVAWSGDRTPGADGKLPPVGNTVDVANAIWTNTIGAPELIAVWKDPDFDPALRAFYYARVIEIPTPRWTAYDQKRFGIKMADDVPMTVRSAPIPRRSGTRRAEMIRVRRLLREPLVHFLAIGAVLLAVSTWVDGNPSSGKDRIDIGPGEVESLALLFQRTWQRPPMRAELDGLIEARVREEVLYREALKLGLDRDDTVVRRRLQQKMEFVGDELAAVEPTDAELQAFLAANAARFRQPERWSFRQVFVASEAGDGWRRAEAIAGIAAGRRG